ncbi:unnamed protein product [Adineta steineri]|uniref:Uncharacterized protein n=1 Tax=Adineta steineri TaxID=433720 RepID=A0A815KNS7_9BILA|nr:unnamed protein product [Adineta steineri]
MGHKTEENMGAGESSSNNNITGPVPIRVQTANPLLYTLAQDHMNIQPYWIMILQLIAQDIILKCIWNRIRYRTWSNKQEIVVGLILINRQAQKYQEARNAAAQFEDQLLRRQSAVSREPTKRLTTAKQCSKRKDVATQPIKPHNIRTTDLLLRFFRLAQSVFEPHIEESLEKLNERFHRLRFDSYDFIGRSLPLLGHAIWELQVDISFTLSLTVIDTNNCL